MALAIDTQKAFDRFINAGFDKEQAQALVEFETTKDQSFLATKADIITLDAKIENMEARLIARIYGGQIASVVAVVGALKLFGLF